jgi:RHH-type transcriptional regulator, proline utilization regulon repressor / proline dehydrogenase / delta 1-pyrroline-5-carboxylate dehydrogenase
MEEEIQALARQLLAAAENREPVVFSPGWWQERLLDWAAGDPEFRVKLLRFVDVLPSLRSSGAVADHVRQYFRDDSPALVHAGAQLAAPAVFRPVVSRVVRESVFAMAHRFIAGESPEQAVPRLKRLAEDGVAYTVDLLGEAVLSDREADAFAGRYAELTRVLARDCPGPTAGVWSGVPPVNVSVKLSALCAHFEPAAADYVSTAVRSRLLPLLRLAREHGALINVDMEQYALRDLTMKVFADTVLDPDLRDYEGVGIVVQAYLKTAEASIRFLRDLAEERGAPITVRLVKGAYWEEERIIADQNGWQVPVYEDKAATDASFESCTNLILDAWPHLRPAFGSHNPRSVAQAIVKSRERRLEADIEFQMLFGMAETLREAVADQGFRTRVYVPVGAVIPGMAYLVRRLLENTSNQSWFVKESLEVPVDEIIAPPKPVILLSQAAPGGVFLNAPIATYHEAETRRAQVEALEQVRSGFGDVQPLLLAANYVSATPLAEVRSPAEPSLLLGRVAQASPAEVELAVAGAREGFEDWRSRDVAERAAILRDAAALMEERRFELAALMVYESAKPWREADGDVAEACDYLRYYADQAERLMRPEPLGSVMGEENLYLREPRGVTAVIAPWNFPLAIITGMSAGALATGNSAILKPAEQSPLIAARLVEILQEAGVPPAAVQYLPGPGSEVGRALVEHPDVATIAFTGSKEVGLGIIASAAQVRPGQKDVKRVIVEMGGKNAIIIDEDADLDQAVAGAVASAFGYAGQKCSACSRLIVIGSAYPEVESRLSAAIESLVVGPPDDPATIVPPVISEEARARIESYIEEGKRTARLLAQARVPDREGYYIPPTAFADIDATSPLARDEIFGPVLAVFHVKDMEAALDLALDSEFALTGGLFSRNPRNIELARRSFRVGNLYINRKITGATVGRHAFGGLRFSGVGDKAGGPDYLLQFLSPRTVSENTTRRGFAPANNGRST